MDLPKEILSMPKFVIAEKFLNIVSFTIAKTGGHFSAFEIPEALSADIIMAINLMHELRSKNAEKLADNV